MASTLTPVCEFGRAAPDFDLPATDGNRYTLAQSMGRNGLLVMFICNHCPYVKAILPRLINACQILKNEGVGIVAIMSNDASDYPEDSWESMKQLTHELALPFPYLLDASQSVAKSYGAVCTPDFFGFNRNFELQYRGRFDASRKESAPEGTPSDLLIAMQQIAATGFGPEQQIASIGCSIKWHTA